MICLANVNRWKCAIDDEEKYLASCKNHELKQREKLDGYEQQINQLKDKKHRQKSECDAMEKEIDRVRQEFDKINKKFKVCEKQMASLEGTLEKKKSKHDSMLHYCKVIECFLIFE